uniref:Copy number control protein n=1 Tax=Onion yellows phytoplasma TaxID=100379 RepID=B9A9P0_ONYPH|nr:DUF2963 domain-containing protein [Onion yellows phytoplasma]BAH22368.1 copy number control protein [Onion yellows phytoplasma]
MKTNDQTKSNNKIFIILGLFITGVILVFLIILLLSINKLQSKTDIQNQKQVETQQQKETQHQVNIPSQQEQKIYNDILKKIDKEIDKLTIQYPPKTIYQKDGITPKSYEIYDSKGKLLKDTYYKPDGKTIYYIAEYDENTNIMIKATYYKPDGKTIDYINEYTPTGIQIKTTYYNQDGTVKKVKNL